MNKWLKFILILVLILMLVVPATGILAQDGGDDEEDQGSEYGDRVAADGFIMPGEPPVSLRTAVDNLCYEGGQWDDGRCGDASTPESRWFWWCGWWVAHFLQGEFGRGDVPDMCQVALPPPPPMPEYAGTGVGGGGGGNPCVGKTGNYWVGSVCVYIDVPAPGTNTCYTTTAITDPVLDGCGDIATNVGPNSPCTTWDLACP